MNTDKIQLENFNKFISLIVRRYDKSLWHTLPGRTREVFYGNKDINKWIIKASITDKMFLLSDLGFDSAMVVFPTNHLSISDIPELSQFTFKIENRIHGVQKQLEKELFAVTTRDIAPVFYNLSQNSNSTYFGVKHDFKALKEANDDIESGNFKSAMAYQKARETRESILKFVLNVLTDFCTMEIGPHEITILSYLREFNELGARLETIVSLFKGTVGQRQIQNYISDLIKKGHILRTGNKQNTAFMLSSSGMLFIQDYADRILSL